MGSCSCELARVFRVLSLAFHFATLFFPYFGGMAEHTTTTAQIKEFYDGHAKEIQQHVGVNIRHRSIMQRLRRAGLHKDHRVLEIGCGIGTLTSLLAKYVSVGTIHAVDISEGAVQIAQDRHLTAIPETVSTSTGSVSKGSPTRASRSTRISCQTMSTAAWTISARDAKWW